MRTTLVTGATGFIGRAFVPLARASGRRLIGLGRSPAALAELETLVDEPLAGDLLEPGPWQRRLREVDEVVHLAQPQTFGGRVTKARAHRYAASRLEMDRQLLDPLTDASVERVLYVGGTSYYGHQGVQLVDEAATPNPTGWGPYIEAAINSLDTRIAAGLPCVVAFPGYVYGPGSWFGQYFYATARAQKPLTELGGRSRMGTFVHVDDCAAALLHLLDHGALAERYFVVDDAPRSWAAFSECFVARAPWPVRIRKVPRWMVTALLGPIASASLNADCCLASTKLRATGFVPEYPTIEDGLPSVVAALVASDTG